jgi:hypothetical protein
MADFNPARIPPGPPVHQYQPQAIADKGTQGIPVLDMEKSTPLAKDLALILSFYTQSQLQMNLANARLQQLQGGIINRAGSHMPLSNVPAQISILSITGFVITGVLCYGGSEALIMPQAFYN